jgi:selenide,water dikinase
VSAMTDITGYGLIGHAMELAEASRVRISIKSKDVPVITGAIELAERGMLTGGGKDNIAYCADRVVYRSKQIDSMIHLLHDPQTSGGLLIAVHPDDADNLASEISANGTVCSIIGNVEAGEPGIEIH